jgi:hypothetical protein
MKSFQARLLVAVLLAATPALTQDTATLDGEPAIRFLAGHGHLTSYCEGQLTVTPARVRFESLTMPRHSFDLKREQVKDVHAGSLFGLHYIKLKGGGKTYRLPLYPGLDRPLGDRFALFVRAFREFAAAHAEVARAQARRAPGLAAMRLNEEDGQPVLEFPVLAGPGVLWFKQAGGGVTVWADEKAGAEAYARIVRARRGSGGVFARGKLVVSAGRVRFESAGAPGDANVTIDSPRSEMRLNLGVGGYPRVVAHFRYNDRISVIPGAVVGDGLQLYDATPLLRALGPEFAQVVEELRQADARRVR